MLYYSTARIIAQAAMPRRWGAARATLVVMMRDLLDVAEVAAYLDVHPVTIYRWCREGRLPCAKVGRAWRVPRAALEDFVRRGTRGRTLAEHLDAFLAVPDHVIGIADTPDLLHRLDAAFFQVGEARGDLLVKYYYGEPTDADALRAALARHGLDVARLEREERLRFTREHEPRGGRPGVLERLLAREASAGRSVWAVFDWVGDVDLDEALRQQRELTRFGAERQLVIVTNVLARVADDWTRDDQRRARQLHHGQIRLAADHCYLGRLVPLPAA